MALAKFGGTATATRSVDPTEDSSTEKPVDETKTEPSEVESSAEPEVARPDDTDKSDDADDRVKAANDRASTAEGRLLRARADATQITGLATALQEERARNDVLEGRIKDLFDHATSDMPDADQLKAKGGQYDQQLTRNQVENSLRDYSQDINGWLGERLQEFDLDADDERLGPASSTWEQAQEFVRSGRLFEAQTTLARADRQLRDMFDVIRTEHSTETNRDNRRRKADNARKSANVDDGKSTAVGAGDQELVNRMARGDKMSPKEIAKAGEAMDNGVYPKT